RPATAEAAAAGPPAGIGRLSSMVPSLDSRNPRLAARTRALFCHARFSCSSGAAQPGWRTALTSMPKPQSLAAHSGRTDMLKPTEAESVSAAPTAPSRVLSEFLAALRFEAIPEAVVARTEDLFLDWLAS